MAGWWFGTWMVYFPFHKKGMSSQPHWRVVHHFSEGARSTAKEFADFRPGSSLPSSHLRPVLMPVSGAKPDASQFILLQRPYVLWQGATPSYAEELVAESHPARSFEKRMVNNLALGMTEKYQQKHGTWYLWYIFIHIYWYIYIYIQIHLQLTHVAMNIAYPWIIAINKSISSTHICIYIYTHTYIYIYTYTYIHYRT